MNVWMESPKTVKHPNFLFMYHTNGIPYVSDDVMVRMRLTSFTQVDTVSLFFNVFYWYFHICCEDFLSSQIM